MPSAQSAVKLFGEMVLQAWDHDPGATAATITSPDGGTIKRYVDMRDYRNFAVLAFPTIVAAGGLTKVEIVAAEDAAGTNATVIVDSGVVAADAALVDWVVLECTAEQIDAVGRAAGRALRYVGARLTNATATDEVVVFYLRTGARFPQAGLTANNIS